MSTNDTVVPIPPETVPRLLTDVFFAPFRVILETADITRQCHCLDDLTFALLGVWRALQAFADAAAVANPADPNPDNWRENPGTGVCNFRAPSTPATSPLATPEPSPATAHE